MSTEVFSQPPELSEAEEGVNPSVVCEGGGRPMDASDEGESGSESLSPPTLEQKRKADEVRGAMRGKETNPFAGF